MVLKRDMTAAESNFLQCGSMTLVAGILIVVCSDWDAFGYISALLGLFFFGCFVYMKIQEDKKTIAAATKTVRKDQPKDAMKVRYTTRKERKAAKEEEEKKSKKSFPANKQETIKKQQTKKEN